LLETGSGARWTNQPPDVRIGYPPSTTPLFFASKSALILLAPEVDSGYSLAMYPFAPPEAYVYRGRPGTVAEHMGYSPKDRLLIINADDFGLNSNVNGAIAELFGLSRITSATIMVSAAGYQDALKLSRRQEIFPCGVHLSLTSDFTDDGSQPVSARTSIPSLIGRDNRFHPDRNEFFESALPEEAYREAKAQIERAFADGLDVTHIDSHEGALQLRPEFAAVYLQLASEFRLPVRAGSRLLLKQMGILEDWVGKIRQQGIHVPDNLVYIPIDNFRSYQEKEKFTLEVLSQLPTGITEIYFHPTLPNGEAASYPEESYRQIRQWDYRLLLSDRWLDILQDKRIILTDFRQLRELTRDN
jgi:chitin disaccharide deacetylase